MRVLALEPYFGLSHRSFLEGYRKYSRNQVEIWPLPARKWKWRMRGSAYHFAERARGPDGASRFDVLLVSDFLNLPDFLAMAPARFRDIPSAVYFHENQITYPLGENAPVEFHYGWINVSTALAADRIIFNSRYHRQEFLDAVNSVFRQMPDHVPETLLQRLLENSLVLPVGIDFEEHDRIREAHPRRPSAVPVLLWNHRWEYDKGPDTFFEALRTLREEGVPFRLVVCGQSFKKRPAVFEKVPVLLGDRLDHFGFFEDRRAYLERARQCDVVVSTAVHEFFGVAIVEAAYTGCLPVLPGRLSYPEIIPPHLHPLFLYGSDGELVDFLRAFLAAPPVEYRQELREHLRRFHWKELALDLDRELEALAKQGRS